VSDTPFQGDPSPFDKLLGLRVETASADRVRAVLPVTPDLHQPHGIVHGGVYAAVVETVASIGAQLALDGAGRAVGISNHTEFLHAVRRGELHAEATPMARGRSTQLWEVAVSDGRGRLLAHGRVRLINLRRERGRGSEPETEAGGRGGPSWPAAP
jgi:1,4-dihydroxy-2-naphthoyl-CoA hydrolase